VGTNISDHNASYIFRLYSLDGNNIFSSRLSSVITYEEHTIILHHPANLCSFTSVNIPKIAANS
jgi:hypothetical protein